MMRGRRYGWVGICPFCRRKGHVCDVDLCTIRRARGDKPKAVAKAQPPLVCVVCGRPGCWTDKAGCPGAKGETG